MFALTFNLGVFAGLSWFLVRQVAVVTGLYKDPLLGQFRRYGDEVRHSPLVIMLAFLGGWSIAVIALLDKMAFGAGWTVIDNLSMIFGALAFMSFIAAYLVHRYRWLAEALPPWYFTLLRTATREERRFIAYHWLRIPRRMRWRLNGDQRAFQVWTDMVRIAFIYGAYDPNSTWDRWQ